MIKNIEITGFQSHVNSKFDFVQGINAIIGSSDSGKSAVLCAFNWVNENKPIGDAFINHSSDNCAVKIGIGNNIIIRNKNRKTINKYELITDGGEPVVFKAFGQDVPDDILKMLNFDVVNLQRQFDSHFLLSESANEVARVFNRVVNIDIIDEAISNIEKMRKSTNTKLNGVLENIDNIKLEKDKFLWIDDKFDHMNEVSKLINEYEQLDTRYDTMCNIVNKIMMLDIDIEKYDNVLLFDKDIKEVFEYEAQFNIVDSSMYQINSIYNEYVECIKFINIINKIEDVRHDIALLSTKNDSLNDYIKTIGLLVQLKCVLDEISGYVCIEKQLESDIQDIISDGIVCPVFGIECRGYK